MLASSDGYSLLLEKNPIILLETAAQVIIVLATVIGYVKFRRSKYCRNPETRTPTIYSAWLKRIFALAIAGAMFYVVLYSELFIANAPAKMVTAKYIVALAATIICIVAAFYVLLIFVPKPPIPMDARWPKLARFFHYMFLFFFAQIIAVIISNTLVAALVREGLFPAFLRGGLAGGLGPLLGTAAAFAYGLYRACRLPSASKAIADDGRPPVVYLRSFGDERKYSVLIGFREALKSRWRLVSPSVKLESVLASALEEHGPFVALGKPRQLFPVEGAARDWVAEDWQPHIVAFLKRARAVLFLPGRTSGLAWELTWLHQAGMMDKVAFVMPPVLRWYRRKIWRGFCSATQLGNFVAVVSEDEALNSVILYVKHRRLCTIVGKRNYAGYIAAISRVIDEMVPPSADRQV